MRMWRDARRNGDAMRGSGGGANPARGNDRRETLAALLGAGLASAAASAPDRARAEAVKMAPIPGDELFMRMAIDEAARADFPFGAVIVRDGKVLAAGRNQGRSAVSARRGPPMSSKARPSTCPMCMGAILWCGIGRVVFAASIDELV